MKRFYPSMEPRKVLEIAETLHEVYGSEISGTRDPEWGILRTVVSQNTNEENTRRGFERMQERFSTIRDLADADEEDLADVLKPAGLYNQKARRIQNLARWLLERGGMDDILEKGLDGRQTLMELPGVGPKTADVTMAFSAGLPIVPVDTHVFRVTKRLGVASEDADYDAVREAWESVLPERLMPHVHLDLIRHGREVCKARNPGCGKCQVSDLCEWPDKERFGYDG